MLNTKETGRSPFPWDERRGESAKGNTRKVSNPPAGSLLSIGKNKEGPDLHVLCLLSTHTTRTKAGSDPRGLGSAEHSN